MNAVGRDERAIVEQLRGRRVIRWMRILWQASRHPVDTAGIRKKSRVDYGIDYFSVLRALQSIDRCDVALLVLDATEPATAQDVTIARYVREAGRGLILVVNKWDLVPPDYRDAHRDWMKRRLEFLSFVPVLHVSAKQRRHVRSVLQKAFEVAEARRQKIARSTVDAAIAESVQRHPPPRVGTRRLDIVWAHQDDTEPWKFVLHVNDPALVPPNYVRFLEHDIRRHFGFNGVPLLFDIVPAGRRKRVKDGYCMNGALLLAGILSAGLHPWLHSCWPHRGVAEDRQGSCAQLEAAKRGQPTSCAPRVERIWIPYPVSRRRQGPRGGRSSLSALAAVRPCRSAA